jgi:signal transduction histidine kinase
VSRQRAIESPARAGEHEDALDDVVRAFPAVLETLRRSYGELEARAVRVERELCVANESLEEKVRELDTLRSHLSAVLQSLPCGVVVRDAEQRITHLNHASGAILGLSPAPLARLVGQRDLPLSPRLDGKAADPQELVRPDGRRLVLASRRSEVRLDDGTVQGSVEILDDHTERTALAERLHAADKMAALGTLAAGIAHEIRNPLNAVTGFAALIQRELASGDGRLRRWAELIVAGASEADHIIENMLSFGHPERLRLEPVDGDTLLFDAHTAARAGRESVQLGEVTCRSTAPPFRADALKLRQALRNLIANAAQAAPGGPIELTLAREDDDIVARVADSGPGVPTALRQRILDPIFPTRAEGTGLGLALVSTIAQLPGGSVSVRPEPSTLGGAEFVLRIPFSPSAETAATPS